MAWQEIPFLRSLLNGTTPSKAAPSVAGGSGEAKEVPGITSASTFLCLYLAGDDSSTLFEVACRALFRLRPRQLPRFVERLARFRTYADDIESREEFSRKDGRVGHAEAAAEGHGASSEPSTHAGKNPPGGDERSIARDGGSHPGSGAADSSHGDELAVTPDETAHDEPPARLPDGPTPSYPGHRRDASNESLRAVDATEQQPSRAGSRDGAGARQSLDKLPGSTVSPPAVPGPPATEASGGTPPGASGATATPTAQEYYSRALACLPPAAEDGAEGSQRRARLALLMGARMFTEASRLLCARAWQGATHGEGDGGKRWTYDPGARSAWASSLRLLRGLRRMAREEGTATGAAITPGASAASAVCYGSASLQYRVVFEDMLTQAILADDPDRMETVMAQRPAGLLPVAVVRMVRRSAACAAGSVGPEADGGDGAPRKSSCVEPWGPGPGLHALATSTRSLKRCLLLLVEDQHDGDQQAPRR